MSHLVNYFTTGHTANGFINLTDNNLQHIHKVILLDHDSNLVTTYILQKIIKHYEGRSTVEVICSTRSEDYINGIIIRNLSIAVLTKDTQVSPLNSIKKVVINAGGYDKEKIAKLNHEQQLLTLDAYQYFKKGLNIHLQLEKIYISQMNFGKADQVKNDISRMLFKNCTDQGADYTIYKRLFGTNTADGIVNQVDNLMAPIDKRVFLKGRAGTGKSYLMKQLLNECNHYHLDVEVYYCSLDPSSIDMIIVRELDFCILDSTHPHEFFPSKKRDMLIDMYEIAGKVGSEAKNITEIQEYKTLYKQFMKMGINKLKETKQMEREKESIWIKSVDERYNDYCNQIINEIELG